MLFFTVGTVSFTAIGMAAGVQAHAVEARQSANNSLVAPGTQFMLAAKLTQDGSSKTCFNQESLHYLYCECLASQPAEELRLNAAVNGDQGVTRASTTTLDGDSSALLTQVGSKLWMSFDNSSTSARFDLATCSQGSVGVLCDYPEAIKDPSLAVYDFVRGTSE